MYPPEAFRPTLLKVVDLLRRLDIPFHVTGGIATGLYSEPRYTQDADIVVDRQVLRTQLDSFMAALQSERYEFDSNVIRQAVQDSRLFQMLDLDEMLKVDVYPRELVPGELDRSISIEVLPGMELPVVARSDLVVAKLIWISKGSHKSRWDLRQLLRRATAEEMDAVRQHADALSLTALLDEVLSEPDEIE